MLVASDEATPGSVIAKAERIGPRAAAPATPSSAPRCRSFTSSSMLPVSGAEQLKISGATCERPMISQSGAYSRFVSPAPNSRLGQEQVPQPCARAFSLSSSSSGGGGPQHCRAPRAAISSKRRSFG
jgi:hypothetical protein